MKKCLMLLVALVLFSATLFAAPVVVTWEWMLDDPMVTTFRYQIDGEEPNNWEVVDASVTSYTVKGLDGSKSYTLYLQQSYDGENFSGSAVAKSEPIFPAEPEMTVAEAQPAVAEIAPAAEPVAVDTIAPAAEEVIAAEPVAEEVIAVEPVAEEVAPVVVAEPVAEEVMAPVVEEAAVVEATPVVVEQPAPVVSAPVVAQPAPVVEKKAKADSRYKTTITLGGGINYQFVTIPSYTTLNLQAELGVQLKNLMTFNDTLGLGVDLGFAYSPYLAASHSWRTALSEVVGGDFNLFWNDLTQAVTFSVAPMLNMEFGKVEAGLGLGGFVTYGPAFSSSKSEKYMAGAFAKLGLAYQFNSWFSMGLDAKYNFVLTDSSFPTFVDAKLFLGFTF